MTMGQDFHSFMLFHRYDHEACPVEEIRHAFECGWELGYQEHARESGVTTILLLCGLIFLMVGIGMQL